MELSGGLKIFVSLILGAAFGFVIYKAGFHNRKTLFDQFMLKENQWLKVFFFSIAVGTLLFYGAFCLGLIKEAHVKDAFFWAIIVGALFTSAGILVCGHVPVTALTALGTGRLYVIWVLIGMCLAIPATYQISGWLSSTIYEWQTPFDTHTPRLLGEYFSSRLQVVLWTSCLALIITFMLEISLSKKKDE